MKPLSILWPDVSAMHADIPVVAVTLDSRMVRPGMAFIALKGHARDARDFIPEVIAAGAVAIFAERDEKWPLQQVVSGVPVIVVESLDQHVGLIAARFHDHPSQHMKMLAVTGTNGKTSVANLLAGALVHVGEKAAVLGTIGNGIYGALEKSTHTTLDAISLQAVLSGFRRDGAQAVAMEASSHGLVQGRLNGTRVDVAIFTNLTRDHLDYHGDMSRYAAAKEGLFRWPELRVAVLNADDPMAVRYQHVLAADVRCLRYSQFADSDADIRALHVEPSLKGLVLKVATPEGDFGLTVPLLGRFNVSNILAVTGGLMALGLPLADIAAALRSAMPVPGRMEALTGAHPTVVVDYAHTPDALEKVLSSLREHTKGRLMCVFGCGGDRDAGKRPQMGEIAARLADVVIITSDNPRSESPEAIIADIKNGVGAVQVMVQKDRHVAIQQAVHAAGADDIVVIAGKGHEDYQEISGVRYPFSDMQEVRAAIASWRPA
jgi:UDP-N-acetylmuramoyl-L-alanyl-D-glutamate--2,6-diaminopimelate ligase